jgi:hypothetical protein
MATLDELLAEKERRISGAPAPALVQEPVQAPAPTQVPLEELLAEKERRVAAQPQFATDPTLTPERVAEMGELTNIGAMLEEREYPVSAEMEAMGLGKAEEVVGREIEDLTQIWLNLTTPDPMELGQQLTKRFPNDIEVVLSPEGVPTAINKHKRDAIQKELQNGDITEEEAAERMEGVQVAINRPGMSPFDVMQAIGIIGAYAHPTRWAGAVSGLGKRIIAGMFGAGATETGLQAGQALAGGEFDESDVALATALGPAAELAKPLAALGTKAKELVKPLGEIVPKNIMQALKFAEERGFKITTGDALKEYLTFPMQLFFKISERIPVFGTSRLGVAQTAQRADALSKIAENFNINIETEFGQNVIRSFVDRMIKQRFWGKNKNPSGEMIQRAFKREGDEITDIVLGKHLRRGGIDEGVVDKVLDSGKTARIHELLGRLDAQGQQAVRQRFIAQGLEKAGWTAEGAQVADPKKFFNYLNAPKNQKTIRAMFGAEDQEIIKGTREYLRLTAAAGDIKGAGMTAAMAAGAGWVIWDLMTAAVGGIATGLTANAVQSAAARNLFLRIAHAEGNPALTQVIMQDLRPILIGLGQQAIQGVNPIDLDVDISQDMVKEPADEALGYLRSQGRMAVETYEDVSTRLQEMLQGGRQ